MRTEPRRRIPVWLFYYGLINIHKKGKKKSKYFLPELQENQSTFMGLASLAIIRIMMEHFKEQVPRIIYRIRTYHQLHAHGRWRRDVR